MKKILLLSMLVLGTTTFAQTVSLSEQDKADAKQLLTKIEERAKDATTAVKASKDAVGGVKGIYNDGKDAIGTIYTDVKSLGPKVEGAINELAKGLKVGAESVWKILVKQQKVWSWCYLIGMIITIVSWTNFWYRFKTYYHRYRAEDTGWSGAAITITTVCFIISIGLSFMSITHLEPMMTGFINPEWGAMMNIVEIAKTLK